MASGRALFNKAKAGKQAKMETDKYYFRVGVFFLLVIAGFVYFLSMFILPDKSDKYYRYVIYFDGAVSGLTEGSRVTYKGIDVGYVSTIGFHSYQSDAIEVLVDIEKSAPIREDTVASVRLQGITGTSYIFLQNTRPDQPPVYLYPDEDGDYLEIPSQPSDLHAALTSAPEILGKISTVGDRINLMLSDRNLKTLSSILDSLDDLMAETNQESVEDIMRNLDGALIEAKITLREYKLLAKTLREDPSLLLRRSKHQGYELRE
jgi:phospholipid/cholesterol/gamma-HCH transport system substrate-binding protein